VALLLALSSTSALSQSDTGADEDLDERLAPRATAKPGQEKIPVSDLLSIASAQEKKSDWLGMIETLEPHQDRLDKRCLMALAKAYAQLKRNNSEQQVWTLALARHPKDAALQTQYATSLVRARKFPDGIAAYYKAIEFNRKYVPAYDGLIDVLISTGSNEEARNIITDANKRMGVRAKWLNALCGLYAKDSFFDKAIETCRKAMEKDPDHDLNPVHLALSYRDQGEVEKARRILELAASRMPKGSIVRTRLADYHYEKRSFVDATQVHPKNVEALLGLGNSSTELQKFEEALQAFTRACELDRYTRRHFQAALGKVKVRRDAVMQTKFEDAIFKYCQPTRGENPFSL
jgi:tetratricopeptide (TPR) repeat protein